MIFSCVCSPKWSIKLKNWFEAFTGTLIRNAPADTSFITVSRTSDIQKRQARGVARTHYNHHYENLAPVTSFPDLSRTVASLVTFTVERSSFVQ
jgi:hypothetical protein